MGRLMAVSTFLLRKFRRFPLIALIGVVLFCLGLFVVNDSETAAARAQDRNLINAKVEIKPETAEHSSKNKDVSIGPVTSVDHEDERIKMAVDKLFKDVGGGNWSTVYENQLRRQRQLAATCKKLGLGLETPNFKTSDMYVNDSLQYIYCVVNKVACTSWKRVLLVASGQLSVEKPEKLSMTFVHNWRVTDRYMPRIRNYELEEVQSRLKTHFKFMFVRHPLERLVSTYRDKFTKPAYYYKRRFGTKIIRVVRGENATKEALHKGHDVKFREMVQFLLNPGPTIKRRDDRLLSDNHWRRQNDLCHPCYVRYDFVGHYETLVEDAQFVLARLGVADRVNFPGSDPDNKWKQKTIEVANRILSEITPDELERVRQLYKVDSDLFGYSPDLVVS